MGIGLSDFVEPLGSFAIAREEHLLGGYRSVADTTERDAIPAQRRKEGMLVHVRALGQYFRLDAGLTNSDWLLEPFGGGGGGYTTIEENGVPLTQRATMNFIGEGVSLVDLGGKTQVQIPGDVTVLDEGTIINTRRRLNFLGAGVTAVDNPGQSRVDITIPGGGGGGSAPGNMVLARHQGFFREVGAPGFTIAGNTYTQGFKKLTIVDGIFITTAHNSTTSQSQIIWFDVASGASGVALANLGISNGNLEIVAYRIGSALRLAVFLDDVNVTICNLTIGFNNTTGNPTVSASVNTTISLGSTGSTDGYRTCIRGIYLYFTALGRSELQAVDLTTNTLSTVYTHSGNLLSVAYGNGKLLVSDAAGAILIFTPNLASASVGSPTTVNPGVFLHDIVFDGYVFWARDTGNVFIFDENGTQLEVTDLANGDPVLLTDTRLMPDGIGGCYVAAGNSGFPNTGKLYRFIPKDPRDPAIPGTLLSLGYTVPDGNGRTVGVTDNGDVAVAYAVDVPDISGNSGFFIATEDDFNQQTVLGPISKTSSDTDVLAGSITIAGAPTFAGANAMLTWSRIEITVNDLTINSPDFLVEILRNGNPQNVTGFTETGTGVFYLDTADGSEVAYGDVFTLRIGKDPPATDPMDWTVRWGLAWAHNAETTVTGVTASPTSFTLDVPNAGLVHIYHVEVYVTVNTPSGAASPTNVAVRIDGNIVNSNTFDDNFGNTNIGIPIGQDTDLSASNFELDISNPDDPISFDWDITVKVFYWERRHLLTSGTFAIPGEVTDVTIDYNVLVASVEPTMTFEFVVNGNIESTFNFTEAGTGSQSTSWSVGPLAVSSGDTWEVRLLAQGYAAQQILWDQIGTTLTMDGVTMRVESWHRMAREDREIGDFKRLLLDAPDGLLKVTDRKITATASSLSFPGEAQGDIIYRDNSDWTVLPAGTAGQVLRTAGPSADPSWEDQLQFVGEAQGDLVYRDASAFTRLPAGTAGQVLRTGGTGADPSWEDQLQFVGEAQGDIIYRDASTFTRLPAGTAGQVLRTGGTGADPSWEDQLQFVGEAQGDIIYRDASAFTLLPAGTAGQVLRTGGPGADPSWTDQLQFAGEAQGDIIYRNASGWVRLAAGTLGQVLKTQGPGANPIWDTDQSGSVTTLPNTDNGAAMRYGPSSRGLNQMPGSVTAFSNDSNIPATLISLAYDGQHLYALSSANNNCYVMDPISATLISTLGMGASYQQVHYLGFVHKTNTKRYVAIGTGGVQFFTIDSAGSFTLGSRPITTSCGGGFFDGVNLFVQQNSGGTNLISRFYAVLQSSTPSAVTLATGVFCKNTNGYGPTMVRLGSYLFVIDQSTASGGTNSLYRVNMFTAVVGTFSLPSLSKANAICTDGRYVYIGDVGGAASPQLLQMDPEAANPVSSGFSRTFQENGVTAPGTSITYLAFDGRRVLVQQGDISNTTDASIFAIDPDLWALSVLTGPYNSNTYVASTAGVQSPRGMVAVDVGPAGGAAALFAVGSNGLFNLYDPQPTDVRNLAVRGSVVQAGIRTITATTTLLNTDHTILCNQSGSITLTLPVAARTGQEYVIKDISGTAGTNTITINAGAGSTIDGGSYVIGANYGAVGLRRTSSTLWSVF